MRRDLQRAEDLALLTVLLAAAGFLLSLAHVLGLVGPLLLGFAAVAATCSWLAAGAPIPHRKLQAR